MDTKCLSDNELIQRFVEGNSEAFNILLSRYRKKVYSYLLMLVKHKDIADDIFQETFIKVMRSLKEGRYEDNGKFMPWVSRIAHNMTIDYFRGQRQNNTVSGDTTDWATISGSDFSDLNVEEQSVNFEIRRDVRTLIDRLPAEQREIVVMRHYLELSFKEIADKLDININTALGRMRYAVLNMRRLAEEHNMVLEA